MTTSPQTTLAAIVEDAYRVFARYPCAGSLVVCHCPCCMTKEVEAELVRTPLRQIPSDLLAEYTNSAHGWDDDLILADMRYFLPRYLELMATDDVPSQLGLAQCLNQLGQAHWREKWPADEVDILDRFFDALTVQWIVDLTLIEWPVGWRLLNDVREVLCLTVLAGGDLNRVLKACDEASDPQVAIHMAAARERVEWIDGRPRMKSAYLEDHVAEAEAIGEFLDRPEVDERLEVAFFKLTDERLQMIVSNGMNWVQFNAGH